MYRQHSENKMLDLSDMSRMPREGSDNDLCPNENIELNFFSDPDEPMDEEGYQEVKDSILTAARSNREIFNKLKRISSKFEKLPISHLQLLDQKKLSSYEYKQLAFDIVQEIQRYNK